LILVQVREIRKPVYEKAEDLKPFANYINKYIDKTMKEAQETVTTFRHQPDLLTPTQTVYQSPGKVLYFSTLDLIAFQG
jgi:hypothetical protein